MILAAGACGSKAPARWADDRSLGSLQGRDIPGLGIP
jgi:hypothetical protein